MRKTYGTGYPDTLPALLTWSERNASAPAVTDAAATLTWRALQDRVLRVAGGLRKAGIGAGLRVALWLPNGTDYLAAIFACARLGAVAVHINTRFRAAELGGLLRRTRGCARDAMGIRAGRLSSDFLHTTSGRSHRATLCACTAKVPQCHDTCRPAGASARG